MLKTIDMKDVLELAEKYQMDLDQVIDLLNEGFTIQEAEEIIIAAEM